MYFPSVENENRFADPGSYRCELYHFQSGPISVAPSGPVGVVLCSLTVQQSPLVLNWPLDLQKALSLAFSAAFYYDNSVKVLWSKLTTAVSD